MSAPKKNSAFAFNVCLVDQSARPSFKANPTLAIGDVKISKDGGAFANITTLPTVTPAGGRTVAVALSSSEMNTDRVDVQFVDAAGAEWDDVTITLYPTTQTVEDMPTAVQTADAVLGRTRAGGADGGRTVASCLASLRNKVAFDVPAAGQFTVYADDDTTPLYTGTYSATPGASPVTAIDPA